MDVLSNSLLSGTQDIAVPTDPVPAAPRDDQTRAERRVAPGQISASSVHVRMSLAPSPELAYLRPPGIRPAMEGRLGRRPRRSPYRRKTRFGTPPRTASLRA